MPARAAVLLTGKLSRRGARNASERSGPPIDEPALAASSSSEAPPANANSPRRLIVGGSGSTATRPPCSSPGSGRVCARSSRSGFSHPRVRYARTITGVLASTWITSAAVNTTAP